MKTESLPGWKFVIAVLLVVLGATTTARAVVPHDRCIGISATISESPPQIALVWEAYDPTTVFVSQQVYRRFQGVGKWVEVANLPSQVNTFTDTNVTAGVAYEYFVFRRYDGQPGTASGWLSAGIRAPLVADRGKVILLVDDTMAAPLAAELNLFISDLTGDGWTIVRQNVSRTSTPPAVRSLISAYYRSDPTNIVALILFGHLPVPYSGDYSQDGHPEHFGATSADVYYGDVDGVWTDSQVNDTRAASPRTFNVPGDGKFDQSVLPSDVELQVGRIDLANMPAFALSETELLRQYIVRNHAFRHRLGVFDDVPRRGLIDDNFGFSPGEVYCATGWRSFQALFGPANVAELDWFTTLTTQKYLCAYGCGPGSYVSARGVGNTGNFAAQASLAVFNLLYGSYHTDWDVPDNFLRAPLGGPSGAMGLASMSPGRPHWFLHPMGLGETIGYCTRLAQNHVTSFPDGYEANDCERSMHIALMGDPTLRLHPVRPASGLKGTPVPSANAISVSWSPSTDSAIEGYLLYRSPAPTGPFARVNGALIAGTTFLDRSVTYGLGYTYMVRAVKLESTNGGSYLNPSQGIYSAPVFVPALSGPEINVVGNGAMISDDETTPLRFNDTDFGSAEIGQPALAKTFTVRSAGSQPLTISSVTIAGDNAADFSVNSVLGPLAAGQTRALVVSFSPSAAGLRTARLTILSDDANEGSFDFAIAGTGVPARATLNVPTTGLTLTLPTGGTTSAAVVIANSGPVPLNYTATSTLAAYSYRDSDSFAGPTYSWNDISTTGTLVSSWSYPDDAATPELPLGFDFPIYESTLSAVRICTNGYIGGKRIIPFGGNGPLPNTSGTMSIIAPFWTDAYMDAATKVYWQPKPEGFVVQFENVSMLNTTNRRFTVQAILKPSGEMIFQYKMLTAVGHQYTIGIQNGRADDGLLISYGKDYAHPGMAIRIRPPGLESWLNVGSNAGSIAPRTSLNLPITINAAGLSAGNYFTEIVISTDAKGTATARVPVKLTVTNPVPTAARSSTQNRK